METRSTVAWRTIAAGGLGARPSKGGTRFAAWSTRASRMSVRLLAERPATIPMRREEGGLFAADVDGVGPGALYRFVVDERELPDPYARFLPFGVHGPAEVVAAPERPTAFRAPPLHRMVLYELHVGTFTPEGTYAAAERRLPDLVELGVNALEMLPVAAFPGARGWGYDGVAHFAPFAPYGRPDDLRSLVEAAHRLGLGVLLDVVYNHFGPSGNYLAAYSPEMMGRRGPWGDGPDFGEPHMRAYVLDSARMWLEEYGFDGLRLDATHAIADDSPVHILRELRDLAAACDPPRLLVAEDDRNDPELVTSTGLDAVWADDFHHQVRVLLTGERDGYYAAYEGTASALARTIEDGWTYDGRVYPPSGRPRGRPARELEPERFVYCVQNHDQVGNRALGTRLHHDAGVDALCVATMLLLFLPMTPLLFMGQEWAASSPFLYFTDHDAELGALVSKGRRDEFAAFAAFAETPAAIPDPQVETTFSRSKLAWDERAREPHRRVLDLVRRMLRLRREDAVLSARAERRDLSARAEGDVLVVERRAAAGARTLVANFGREAAPRAIPEAEVLVSTGSTAPLAPRSAVVIAAPLQVTRA